MPQKQGIQLNKYTPDYVVFDLENTGISRTFDEVVEISAVKVRSGQVVDEFSTLVNPGRHIPAGASQVNGITDQMLSLIHICYDNILSDVTGDGKYIRGVIYTRDESEIKISVFVDEK